MIPVLTGFSPENGPLEYSVNMGRNCISVGYTFRKKLSEKSSRGRLWRIFPINGSLLSWAVSDPLWVKFEKSMNCPFRKKILKKCKGEAVKDFELATTTPKG